MNYLKWKEEAIKDSSDAYIDKMYNTGFVFTRLGKGVMHQTRSVRIDLSKFELSSENRRILKKTADISFTAEPLPYTSYDFKIGKMAKDFYETKFEPGIMSAQKVKEMLTDATESNFNTLLTYPYIIYDIGKSRDLTENAYIKDDIAPQNEKGTPTIGYAICFKNPSLLHYSYPFYDLNSAPKDMGLGMMIRAIQYAKDSGLKYIYLGSLQRPGDTYKLQFSGLEWFDGKKWQTDIETAKSILNVG